MQAAEEEQADQDVSHDAHREENGGTTDGEGIRSRGEASSRASSRGHQSGLKRSASKSSSVHGKSHGGSRGSSRGGHGSQVGLRLACWSLLPLRESERTIASECSTTLDGHPELHSSAKLVAAVSSFALNFHGSDLDHRLL